MLLNEKPIKTSRYVHQSGDSVFRQIYTYRQSRGCLLNETGTSFAEHRDFSSLILTVLLTKLDLLGITKSGLDLQLVLHYNLLS